MHLVQAIIQHESELQKEDQEGRTTKNNKNNNIKMTEQTPTNTNEGNEDVTTKTSGNETQSLKDNNPPDVKQDPDENEMEEEGVHENGGNAAAVATTTSEPSSDEVSSTESSNHKNEGGGVEQALVDEQPKKTREELEAEAIAEATASANASYTPSTSVLNSPSPYPLIRSVDSMSLKKYNSAPSVYTARDVPVPLRGKFNVPIHVTLGGSIVEYTVEAKDYDIGFGIVAEREEAVTVVTPLDRTDAHLKPISGKFIVGSVPCALIFTFDNEYSWFREKRITYQITIRPPTKENIIAGRKVRAQTALKVVTKDRIGAEERLSKVSLKNEELNLDVQRLEKELEEKKKSLAVVEKEVDGLNKRVQLRCAQEDLLNRRLADGWEDEHELDDEDEVADTPNRAEI